MKMILKLLIACIVCIAAILIIYIIGVLLFALITEFKPPQVDDINVQDRGKTTIPTDQKLKLLTWNIGYGGLGKEMDFFYEGGQKVRPDKALSTKYLQGISEFLSNQDSLDFILLQEVDYNSKRSYTINQAEVFSNILSNSSQISAINYFSKYVPVPYFNPMGKVLSGLTTFSKYKPSGASRISTPGKYSLPKRLFMLKRCLLISRYAVDNGKELVLINLHNSAFDDAKELRKEEMNMVKQIISEEYEKGNYIIAGGDWNQNPHGMQLNKNTKYKTKSVWPIDKEFLPADWSWAFDPSIPTNRDVHEPFNVQLTTCTVLDYFVTSPNIEVLETKTTDLEFEFSDHQPVFTTIRLNK